VAGEQGADGLRPLPGKAPEWSAAMQFDPCYCPKCGGVAASVTEGVLVRSGIAVVKEGDQPEFDYDGNGCKIDWDTQEMKLFDGEEEQDSVALQCEMGHGWLAELVED
jgi:hypothetical protein